MAEESIDLFPAGEAGETEGCPGTELPQVSKARQETASRASCVVDAKENTEADQIVNRWVDQLKAVRNDNERRETQYVTVFGKKKKIKTETERGLVSYSFNIEIHDDDTDSFDSMFFISIPFDDETRAEIYHRKVKSERRQGLGTYNINLIKAFLTKVAKEQKKPITIWLETDQEDVIGLSRSCGFSERPVYDRFTSEEIGKHFEFEVGGDQMS